MAGNKKPRKAPKTVARRKTDHIVRILRICLSKFHIIGDMNHIPTAFHFGDLAQHLSGMDLKVAHQHAYEWLCIVPRTWTMMGIHYFKTEEGFEVIPISLVRENATLKTMGADGEELLKEMRDAMVASNPDHNEDNLLFYGYYLTYGDDLHLDTVEDQLTESFMKITADFTKVEPHVVRITEEKVLKALQNDKFSISNKNALSTQLSRKE